MSRKVSTILAINMDSVMQLKKEGSITKYNNFQTIPQKFIKIIKQFMIENIGAETGPILGLTRLNRETVSLQKSIFEGDISIIDVLPAEVGNIFMEFLVDENTIVSIGIETFLKLKNYAKELDDNYSIALDMLKQSLFVGAEVESEDNVISFLPKVMLDDCVHYLRFDAQWKRVDLSLFDGIEKIQVLHLFKF